ncbi:hypothetical protein FRB99_001456 [Tulasnella sp. 403]|nr:hypothetical protein FRB99_001456 [Tulasnella sp. 403]
MLSLLILTSSVSAKKRTSDIIVGGDAGLVYTPPVVYAEPGDTLRFWFRAKNHTVTQSSFEHPCKPLKHGFTSGFRPVGEKQNDGFPYFDVKVKNKKPIWIHCEQIDHCPSGMVFAANPDLEGKKTFAKFLAKAKATKYHSYSAKFKRIDEENEADEPEE